MKTATRTIFIRLVIVFTIAGFAYWLGYRRADTQPSAVVTITKHAPNGQGSPVAVTSTPTPVTPARQQAWEQFKALLDNPEHTVNVQLLNKLLNQLDKTDPATISFLLEQIASLPPGKDRDTVTERLFRILGSLDPSKALSMLGLISDSKAHDAMFNILLKDLAKGDPNLAIAELANLPDGPQAQTAYDSVFSGWAKTDGAAAASAAADLPLGSGRNHALIAVVDSWIGNGVNPDLNVTRAALNWASSLPPADSTVVLSDALIAATKLDPALASQYVNNLTDASVRNNAIQSLARTWAVPVSPHDIQHQDPAAALDWLDQVATGDTYDTNVEYIFSKLNPATASTLIAKVTEPGVRETVITTVANNWGKTDPQSALLWLQTLPDTDSATRDSLAQKITQATGHNSSP